MILNSLRVDSICLYSVIIAKEFYITETTMTSESIIIQ